MVSCYCCYRRSEELEPWIKKSRSSISSSNGTATATVLFDYLTPQYQSDSLEVLEAVAEVDQLVFDRVLQCLLQQVKFKLTVDKAVAASGAGSGSGAEEVAAAGAGGADVAAAGAAGEAVAEVASGFSSYGSMEGVVTGLIAGLDELLMEAIAAVEDDK